MYTRLLATLSFTIAAHALCGCQDDPNGESCPDVIGVYVPSYQWLDGSCGSFVANTLSVKSDDRGTVTKVENRLSDTVNTEYIFKGCTLGVNQAVEEMGVRTSKLSGDLRVLDDGQLSGKMMRTEFTTDGAIECNAVYEANYRRQDLIVGGAVQHAAAAK